jgi:hypothetical protein
MNVSMHIKKQALRSFQYHTNFRTPTTVHLPKISADIMIKKATGQIFKPFFDLYAIPALLNREKKHQLLLEYAKKTTWYQESEKMIARTIADVWENSLYDSLTVSHAIGKGREDAVLSSNELIPSSRYCEGDTSIQLIGCVFSNLATKKASVGFQGRVSVVNIPLKEIVAMNLPVVLSRDCAPNRNPDICQRLDQLITVSCLSQSIPDQVQRFLIQSLFYAFPALVSMAQELDHGINTFGSFVRSLSEKQKQNLIQNLIISCWSGQKIDDNFLSNIYSEFLVSPIDNLTSLMQPLCSSGNKDLLAMTAAPPKTDIIEKFRRDFLEIFTRRVLTAVGGEFKIFGHVPIKSSQVTVGKQEDYYGEYSTGIE